MTSMGAIIIGLSFIIFTGCTSHTDMAPKNEIALPETKEQEPIADSRSKKDSESTNVNPGTEADKNVVTLLVYGDWNDEKNVRNEDIEFTLENEQAQAIFDIFYNHKIQIIDSTPWSATTFSFKIGEDFLGTSMGSLRTLSGRINGNLVIVELSDQEYESVYRIVSQYAPDVP